MAIALVAQTTFDHIAATNDTLTYSSSGSGSGSLMVILATRSGGLGTGVIISITDTASNTWTLATRGSVSGVQHTRIECWYTYNYASVTSVTMTSADSQYYATSLSEWSGIETSINPLDVVSPDNSGGASSTTQTVPTINTTSTFDLIIAAIHHTQSATSLDNDGSFTRMTNFDSTVMGTGRASYKFVSSTGSYSDNWTLSLAQAAGHVTASFKGQALVADSTILSQVAIGQSLRLH